MKINLIKKIGIFTGIIFAFFLFTNPSLKQFKEYLGNGHVPSYLQHARRESNYFVFSIYKIDACQGCFGESYYWNEESYIGFLYNFKKIK